MEIVEAKQNGAVVLSLKGRLDASNAVAFEKQVLRLVDDGELQLVIDLAELEYISSAGLRVFLITAKRLSKVNGKRALSGLAEQVREVFDIAGFSSIFQIYPSQSEALKAVQ